MIEQVETGPYSSALTTPTLKSQEQDNTHIQDIFCLILAQLDEVKTCQPSLFMSMQ